MHFAKRLNQKFGYHGNLVKRGIEMGNLVYKQCTSMVVDVYKDSIAKYDMSNMQEKGRTYTSLASMLKENFFLGATKFGENFIA